MSLFKISTKIYASVETCFDLARSIDLHLDTMKHTGEEAIAGTTHGLIGLNETVTWKARHFGVVMKLTSQITAYNYPIAFIDEMTKGPFKAMKHKHSFQQKEGYTLMIDEFIYHSPLGILGKVADALFLDKYLQNLIKHRNQIIKQKAESNSNN